MAEITFLNEHQLEWKLFQFLQQIYHVRFNQIISN